MKTFIKVLIAIIITLLLIGCSWFGTAPIEPKIIGTTNLQQEKGLIFAEIDSTRYAPVTIYTGKKEGRDGIKATVEPTAGMLVTVFTSKKHPHPVFFAGQVSEEKIEQFYYENYSLIVALLSCFFLVAIFFKSSPKQQKESQDLDS